MNPSQEKLGHFRRMNEVEKLHPFLKRLLPRLPHVRGTDYTHGAQELGADFLIDLEDPTIGSTEIVGLVVKSGDLNQRDVQDVIRQLNELKCPRQTLLRAESVSPTRAWVVISGKVSNGARSVIQTARPTYSVNLIDGQRLMQLTDQHFPTYWRSLDADLADHISNAAQAAGANTSHHAISTPELRIQVPVLRSTEGYRDSKAGRRRKGKSLLEWVTTAPVSLLTGDMGSGKTTAVQQAIIACQPGTDVAPITVPNYLHAKSVTNTPYQQFVDLVALTRQSSGVPNADVTLFIDGLDEVADHDHAATILRDAQTLARDDQATRVVVITRPFQELDLVVDEARTKVQRLEMGQASIHSVIKALESMCSGIDLKSRLIEDLKSSALYQDLPRSPIAVALLARIIREQKSGELPSTITSLYRSAMELYSGGTDVMVGRITQTTFAATQSILGRIATHLMGSGESSLTLEGLRSITQSYCDERELPDCAAIVENTIRDDGPLFVDKQTSHVRFRHRSYMEFFCAQHLHDQRDDDLAQRAFDGYWNQTIVFRVGLAGDAPDLMQRILDVEPKDLSQSFLKSMTLGRIGMAAFLTPGDLSRTKCLRSAVLEATRITGPLVRQDTLDPESFSSDLAQHMSPMYALWLFASGLRHSYGYPFFNDSSRKLFDTAPDWCPSEDVEVCRFFLASIAARLGDKQLLERLITRHGPSMTMALKLAVGTTCRQAADATSVMKRFDRNLKRRLSNPALVAQIDRELFHIRSKPD